MRPCHLPPLKVPGRGRKVFLKVRCRGISPGRVSGNWGWGLKALGAGGDTKLHPSFRPGFSAKGAAAGLARQVEVKACPRVRPPEPVPLAAEGGLLVSGPSREWPRAASLPHAGTRLRAHCSLKRKVAAEQTASAATFSVLQPQWSVPPGAEQNSKQRSHIRTAHRAQGSRV